MLSRADLKTYQAHRDYPSISILAPTHRTAPANKQDPIKVKNLVGKAIKRLHAEFPKREVAGVVKNLTALVKNVDWQHTLEGLALFASRDQALSVTLPFKVKPRAMIDETFATRDLVYAYNRAEPYRVLVLGHTAQLFEAWTTVLEEQTTGFPLQHKGWLASGSGPAAWGWTARRFRTTRCSRSTARSMRPWRRCTKPARCRSWSSAPCGTRRSFAR